METYVLDNGTEYQIIENKIINGEKYVLFQDIKDNSNICIRKLVKTNDGKEGFAYLDSEKEFEKVILEFSKIAIEELNT